MEYDRIYSIRKGEYFADALKRAGKDFIPTNCIINKLLPGLGATHCELTAPRKSITYAQTLAGLPVEGR